MSQGVQYDSDDKHVLIKLPSGTKTFTVPSSVQRIQAGSTGNSAFLLCKSTIQSVYFESNSQLTDLQSFCFSETSVESIDFSNCNKLLLFTESLFSNCLSLRSIIFPPNLEQIGKNCFSSSSITSLDIPNSVLTINDFQDCTSLTSISITSNSKLKTIGVLYNIAISQFYIPKYVNSISNFPYCPIALFTVHSENANFDTDGTALYSKDFTILYCVSSYISSNYIVNNKVTKILGNCFTGSNINVLSFPQKPIELQGIFWSSNIKNIIFNNEMNLKEIPNSAAAWDKQLVNVTLPETLTLIGTYSFAHCIRLKNINLPKSLERINETAFLGCTNLLSITIPEKCDLIQGCFSLCSSDLNFVFENTTKYHFIDGILYMDDIMIDYIKDDIDNNITIPSYCKTISYSFFQSKKMNSINFDPNIQSMSFGTQAFAGSTLKSITFPKNLIYISIGAFSGCNSLTTVIIDGKINYISQRCFGNCVNLENVTFLSKNILIFNEDCFTGCVRLRTIDISELRLNTIRSGSFRRCSIDSLHFSSSITTIEKGSFSDSSLREVIIDNVCMSTIQPYTFSDLANLETVRIVGSTVTTLGSYSFSNNPSLTTFYLGPNVSTINEYAFSGCIHLSNFVIPEGSSLHTVQGHSFEGCTSLTSLNVLDKTSLVFRYNALMSLDLRRLIVYLPTSKLYTFVVPSPVVSIEDYAFQGCESLHEIIISDGVIRNIGFKALSFQILWLILAILHSMAALILFVVLSQEVVQTKTSSSHLALNHPHLLTTVQNSLPTLKGELAGPISTSTHSHSAFFYHSYFYRY